MIRIPLWFGGLTSRLWRVETILWLLVACLLLLPLVMVSSIASATMAQMKLQAEEISTLATGIRSYYADNVIARLQAADGQAVYSENYRDVHGGIPIPATLSIELGALFDNAHRDGRVSYEFISDYPFAKRPERPLDSFELEAIKAFRSDPNRESFTKLSGNGLGRSFYRLATPVYMRKSCVACHNSHPDSPKRDWKVGDVRGIQEVTVRGIQAKSFGRLGGLFAFVALLGSVSLAATAAFQRQSRNLARINQKLTAVHERETELSERMADQLQELSLFGTAVDHSIVGITIADMRQDDCPLIYVNHAFTEVTGYSKDLAIGYNCRFLQGPDTDPASVRKIREAIKAGRTYSGELINYRHDGSRFWNRLTLSPVGGVPGRPDFYVANQIDVTHLKEEAGIPLRDFTHLETSLASAQAALADASRFTEALQRHLKDHGDLSVEREALFRSESQSHQQAEAILERISEQLEASSRS